MKLLAFIFEQPSYSVISSIDMPGVKGQGHFYSTNIHNRKVRFEADIIDFNVKSALPSIFLTEDFHIWHNDCLWCVDNNEIFINTIIKTMKSFKNLDNAYIHNTFIYKYIIM